MPDNDDDVERRFTANCLACGGQILCPSEEEIWWWRDSEQVKAFFTEHLAHASPGMVGLEVAFVKKQRGAQMRPQPFLDMTE